jgi:hypothetical protein
MRHACALLIVCCSLQATCALAQDDHQAQAQALFERGLQLSAQERWAEAHAAFTESAGLVPRASTYFNLAVSALEIGLGRGVLDALEQFQLLADPVKHAEYAQRATELRSKALARVGTLELSIAPEGARLEVDGTAESATGTTRVMLIDPGLHVVRVSADGYGARSTEVSISARETSHLRIELSATPMPDPPPTDLELRSALHAPPPPTPPSPLRDAPPKPASSLWSKPAIWIAIGSVVVLGVVGAVLASTSSDPAKPYGGSTGKIF